MNIFKYTDSNKRYHTLTYFYKNKFNSKVFKVSLNAGFTCPNKDGTKGYGGCIYCSKSGSGDYAGNINDSLINQFNEVKDTIHKKWPKSKYIGYFQANTNTYAPVDILKEKYEQILQLDNVVGLSIGTRPDAISDEVLDYLEELNKRTFLTIELGLQTMHESTSKLINRGHDLQCLDNMVHELKRRKIHTVVHIINGLPYETKEMMIETVKHLNKLPIDGIKIHMLHILKDTVLAKMYIKKPFPVLSKEEYTDIVCDQLENLRPEIVIHRITGDPNANDLIEPTWLTKKFGVMNEIDKELARRNTYQGFNLSILNRARQLIINNTKPNDLVIDATIGNGKDTLFLAGIVNNGHVFGFDIQEDAVEKTNNLLMKNNKSNYTLFLKSHEYMKEVLKDHIGKISTIIFNLGYLPNGDTTITTNYKSTIKGIKDAYKLLNSKGLIIIVVYPGHKEGLEESNELEQLNYNINYYRNTDNKEAPYIMTIKK
jgi:radical SAM protein (TIGR01212 family)